MESDQSFHSNATQLNLIANHQTQWVVKDGSYSGGRAVKELASLKANVPTSEGEAFARQQLHREMLAIWFEDNGGLSIHRQS